MMQGTAATVWHRIIVTLVLLLLTVTVPHRMRTGRCCTVAVRPRVAVVVLVLVLMLMQLRLVRLAMLTGRPAVAQRSDVAVLRRTARRTVLLLLLMMIIVGTSKAVRVRIGHGIAVMAAVVQLLVLMMIVCHRANVRIAAADVHLLLLMMMAVLAGGVAVAEGRRSRRCTVDTVLVRFVRTGQSCRHRCAILLLRMLVLIVLMHETGATG